MQYTTSYYDENILLSFANDIHTGGGRNTRNRLSKLLLQKSLMNTRENIMYLKEKDPDLSGDDAREGLDRRY